MLPFNCSPLRQALVIAVGLLCIVSAGAALRSPLFGLTWLEPLTGGDIERMGTASQQVLQHASDDLVAQWQNPESQHAGVVRPIRNFDAHGMPCRTLDYTIRYKEVVDPLDHYVVNWCRLPDGEWKVVELAG
jgi:surface antigen